jgi:alanine racemase
MVRTCMDTAAEQQLLRPTFAEVDLDAYRRNIGAVQRRLPDSSRLIAVLKADGYGHGAVELGRVCADEGVAMIALALLEEALELRAEGIDLPLLILGPMRRDQLRMAVEKQFVIGVPGPEELELLARVVSDEQTPASIHLKLDSGMGRMGVTSGELDGAARILSGQPLIRLEAIYTHFANASDPADSYTATQQERFSSMLDRLRRAGIAAPLHHEANSAATMRGLVRPGDFARVGLSLLGAEPLDAGKSRLEPVLTWKSSISRLKSIPAGHPVGYGTTWRAGRESRIATLPVGYADGYDRLLSGRASVLIRGQRAPLAGRVSMDMLTVDVTDVEGVHLDDEVILLGRSGDEEISAEELARLGETIPYEVFCRISARVPRIFHERSDVRIRTRFETLIRS